MDNLKLIYDFSQRSPGFGVMLFPLLFVFIGIGIFLYNKNIVDKNAKSSFGISKRKFGMFFGLLFLSFTILVSTLTISSHISEYGKTIDVYKNKSYKTVQGLIENYHPIPKGGHDSERFTVQGVSFEYSDYDLTDYGYNNAASNGGAIKEGLFVRINYFHNGTKNVILRLETK